MGKRGEKIQREVLSVLRRESRPLSAYDIHRELRSAHPKIGPPTIYNALAALTKRGSVRRVESLKAYIVCQSDRHGHASILSICDSCGTVEERVVPDLVDSISDTLGDSGFAPLRYVIEIHGVCATCSGGNLPIGNGGVKTCH